MWKKKVVLLSLLAAGDGYAAYDSDDTVKLYADVAYVYDSNVFRLSDKQENNMTREYQQKGDSSVTVGIGGRIDLPLSRQNVYATADFSQTNYLTFSELNGPAWDVGLGWDWVVGNQWSGNLSASTQSGLSSFDDVRISIVDTVKTDSANWSAVWQVVSNWALLANAAYIQEDHDVRIYQNANDLQFGTGLRYKSDRGFVLALNHAWSEHNYEEKLIIPADLRGYTEQNTSLNLNWPVTAKFNVNVSTGYSRWKSQYDGSKNSKPIGTIDLSWKVTDKTTLKTGAQQSFNSFGSNVVGRDLEKSAFISADWAATDKSKFLAKYTYRKLETTTAVGLVTQDSLYDTFLFSYDYKVLRSTFIRSYVQLQKRKERVSRFDYNDEQIGLSLKYNF